MSDSKSHLLAFVFLLCIFKNLSCDINLTFGQTDKVKLWAVIVCLLFKIILSSPPFYFFLTSPHRNKVPFSLQRTWILFNLLYFI